MLPESRKRAALEYSVWEAWKADCSANSQNGKALLVLTLFRMTNAVALQRHRRPLLYIGCLPFLMFYRLLVEWFLCIELPSCTRVGPGLQIHHGQGLVVNGNTIIGPRCILRSSTTIGCLRLEDGSQGPSPIFGADVEIGANAVVLGDVRIGDCAVIGAGAVVLKDVPANCFALGNPARVMPRPSARSS